jgi:GNAT superfamily N-acetyltransferase
MENNIQYRSVGTPYASRVIGLILPIQQIEFNVPIDIDAQPDLLDIQHYYHGAGGGFWGAFHGEELVGTIGLIPFGGGEAAIRKMFVKKEYRGATHGVAPRLLQLAIDHCRNTGIRAVYLGTVEILQAARRFYEKNGFDRIDPENLPPSFPRMPVDTLFYHLAIESPRIPIFEG